MRTDTSMTALGSPERDAGLILPMALVATVVIAAVLVAVATYAATDLRYGQVVEARAGRLAAAQGALDDALEQLSVGNPICSTAGPAGLDTTFPETVNGATVVVNCRAVGTTLPAPDGWALVITGEGAPAGNSTLLDIDNSSLKEISGPVFLEIPNRTDLKKDVRILGGDLWYPDNSCAVSDPTDSGIQYDSAPLTITNLLFEPTRGAMCINRSWDELFGSGPAAANLGGLPVNPAYSAQGACRVFSPGRYTALPLGNNNYFKSGNYVFDNVGSVSLGGTLTMGQVLRQGFPAIDNAPCDAARVADATTGATLYTRGNTRFSIGSNSGLEISGAQQGSAVVSMQVLNSSLGFATPLVTADNGNHKEAAFHGLVWAPASSFVFATTPVTNAAMMRGGAVIAGFKGKVPASSSGFLIEVATAAASARLVLESTATDGRSVNAVRAVVDYRPSSNEVAVLSRRVLAASD